MFTLKLNANEFTLFQTFIHTKTGIFIEPTKQYLIEQRLSKIAFQYKCMSFIEFYNKLATGGPTIINEVIDAITTNETLWFRDKKPFELLEATLIPRFVDLLKAGKIPKIRIWCAASSSGQEPYSIAMIITEMEKTYPQLRGKVEIVASDISEEILKQAETGIYNKISISRGLPPNLLERFFKVHDENNWELVDQIKRMVTFKRINLIDHFRILGHFQIVFCRNVLIYFNSETKVAIYSKMYDLLKPNGVLVIGASETINNVTDKFKISHGEKGMVSGIFYEPID
ncbi:MAG: protein-glutamate O-methyltransferase CheR [Fibrobacterales bacterium]